MKKFRVREACGPRMRGAFLFAFHGGEPALPHNPSVSLAPLAAPLGKGSRYAHAASPVSGEVARSGEAASDERVGKKKRRTRGKQSPRSMRFCAVAVPSSVICSRITLQSASRRSADSSPWQGSRYAHSASSPQGGAGMRGALTALLPASPFPGAAVWNIKRPRIERILTRTRPFRGRK